MTEFWRNEITHEAAATLGAIPDNTPIVGAEVGALRAKTACIMLHHKPQLNLVIVDSWREDSEGPTGEAVYREALVNLEPFRDRVQIIVADSIVGAEAVQDGSLDYVLIDADHTYPKCLADMLVWWPKLRELGRMFHHDIDHPDFPHWDVRRAVEEFASLKDVGFKVNEKRRMAVLTRPVAAMGRRRD